MNFSSTPGRSIGGDDYLPQRVGNISLQNDYRDLYGVSSTESYDTHTENMGQQWDYKATESRNVDSIVTELAPEEVRWFYKTDGEKRWLEFSGYDSYRIEMRYREMFFNKHSSHSAFSDMSGGMGSQFGSSSIRFPSKQTLGGFSYTDPPQQQQHKIVVRGGLYDVNFDTWQCASIYWPGEECMITRGSWFYEGSWQPLDREQSSVLENKHLSMFKGRKVSDYLDNETKGTPVHTETFPDLIVEWFSPNQIYLYSENKPSKIVRSVTSRLGFHKSTGYRLFRGYKTDASLDDRPDVEITHLVFVIHGIGQKMDTGRIIRNTSSPVEWRSNLQLDGELVDAITPNTLQSLRQMLNASAMDIMYYTSPLYGGEVQRGLREELNRLYSMFSARNPYFANKGGKISVIAHSLGCVILYDIIMGLKPGSLLHNAQQGLLFQIQNFFCLGSPLAVFLALRWKDSQIPGKFSAILPPRLCHRLYNVFHPTDPVAYRIEPLLVKEYYRIAPLMIQPYNAGYHVKYGELPLEIQNDASSNQNDCSLTNQHLHASQSVGPGRGLDYRLDYILRESNLGVSYLSALTSHTAYWTNYDIAYFILTQIFPDLEVGGTQGPIESIDCPLPDLRDYPEQPYSEPPTQVPPFSYNQPYSAPFPISDVYPGTSQQQQQRPQYQQSQYQPPLQQPHQQQQLQQGINRYQPPYQQPTHQQQPPPHQQQQQHPQQKLSLFDRATNLTNVMDVKQQQQHASSPTKGTKSFFPSFNLSSLTSPVKNLSNSLSNISNQMTNMATNQQPQQQQMQQQQQNQRTGFFGGPIQQNKPNMVNQQPGQFGQQQQPQNYDHGFNQGGMMSNQSMYNQQQQQQQQQHPQGQTPPPNFNQQHQMQHQQIVGHSSYNQQQPFLHQGPAPQGSFGQDPNVYNAGQQQQVAMQHRYNQVQPRSGSPQAQLQAAQLRGTGGAGLLQFGPLETPTGIVKPKMTRIQPKVPSAFPSTTDPVFTSSGQRGRCVSPLGQSKVVCSRGGLPASLPGSLPGSLPTLPGYGALGGRSLSSGNLRHSSVVSGGYTTYTGTTPTMLPASSPTSSLSRRTMSRPNLSSSSSPSAVGMSSLVYNSSYGTKSYLNRDYSGPSSR